MTPPFTAQKLLSLWREPRLWSSLQVAVLALSGLGIQATLLFKAGPEEVGIWTLAVTAVALPASLPASISVIATREVAALENDSSHARLVTLTRSLIGTGILSFCAVLLAGQPAVLYVLRSQLSAETYVIAAAAANWYWMASLLSILASVLSGVLDGLGSFATRSRIGILGAATGLALAVPLVEYWGAVGAAIAIAVQHLIGSSACLLVLWSRTSSAYVVLPRLDQRLLKLTFGRGLNLQGISVIAALIEWTARHFIHLLGGLAAVGVFDFSWRIIAQSRNVINAAAMPLVTTFAKRGEDAQPEKSASYGRMLRVFLVWTSGLLVLALVSITALRWQSDPSDATALAIAVILSLGMYPALLSTPAYYGLLGAGSYRTPLLAMLAMFGTLLTGGVLGVVLQSWRLAAIGYSASYLVGGTMLVMGFRRKLKISSPFLPTVTERLFAACIAFFAACEIYSEWSGRPSLILQTCSVFCAFLLSANMLRQYSRHQSG